MPEARPAAGATAVVVGARSCSSVAIATFARRSTRDELEVMSMDERFLARLQSRYPRIASKIFLNVSRILSDRLQAQHPTGAD